MSNFWKDLPNPIFALAPMEDVTDTSFREVVAAISNPEYRVYLGRRNEPSNWQNAGGRAASGK